MHVFVGFSGSLAFANKLYIPSELATQMYCNPIEYIKTVDWNKVVSG